MEKATAEMLAVVFGQENIFSNYFVSRGQFEKDVLVMWGDTAIVVECKSSRIRLPVGGPSDLFNFEEDFTKAVQYAYEQALEVQELLLSPSGHIFLDKGGKEMFAVRESQVKRVFIVCVANVPRGPLGTDMTMSLDITEGQKYPLALRYYDLQTILKYFKTPETFLNYLAFREAVHGKVSSGDELNFAGYFYKFGAVDTKTTTFIDDSFSSAFDEEWYQEQGHPVETQFDVQPAKVAMKSTDKELVLRSLTSGKTLSRQKLPDWVLERRAEVSPLTKVSRQDPCPCGSGKKIKRCCGARPPK